MRLGRIVLWILLFQRRDQRIEAPLRGRNRETGLQARDDRSSADAYSRRGGGNGSPAKPAANHSSVFCSSSGRALIAKTSRHHADDMINVVIQAQSLADNVRVGSEFPPPQPVADHGLQVEAGSGIVRIECAAQLRVYTEHREVIRRDLLEGETRRAVRCR